MKGANLQLDQNKAHLLQGQIPKMGMYLSSFVTAFEAMQQEKCSHFFPSHNWEYDSSDINEEFCD